VDSMCNNTQGRRVEETAGDPAVDEPSKITAVNEAYQPAAPTPGSPRAAWH
jgi:hypothetical protein